MSQADLERTAKMINELGADLTLRHKREACQIMDVACEILGMTTEYGKDANKIATWVHRLIEHAVVLLVAGRDHQTADHWVSEINAFLGSIDEIAWNEHNTLVMHKCKSIAEKWLKGKTPPQMKAVKDRLKKKGFKMNNTTKAKLQTLDLDTIIYKLGETPGINTTTLNTLFS